MVKDQRILFRLTNCHSDIPSVYRVQTAWIELASGTDLAKSSGPIPREKKELIYELMSHTYHTHMYHSTSTPYHTYVPYVPVHRTTRTSTPYHTYQYTVPYVPAHRTIRTYHTYQYTVPTYPYPEHRTAPCHRALLFKLDKSLTSLSHNHRPLTSMQQLIQHMFYLHKQIT